MSKKRETFLDYLGSAITRLLINRRRTQKGEPERGQHKEDSAQYHCLEVEEGVAAKECRQPLETKGQILPLSLQK